MTKARDIASAAPAPSTVSATEIGYLDGVTSAIQTQIDSKIGSASAISPTLIDAKGDLIVGSAADTAARLAVGTNNQILTADSSATNGVKWATPTSTSFPAFSAYKNNGNQSIGSSTFTKLTFDTEDFDTGGNFASDTFTVGTAGYYQVSASSRIITNGTSILSLYKNGTAYHEVYEWTSSTQWNSALISVVMYLNVGDTVEIYGYGAVSATSGNGRINTWFSAVGIRS